MTEFKTCPRCRGSKFVTGLGLIKTACDCITGRVPVETAPEVVEADKSAETIEATDVTYTEPPVVTIKKRRGRPPARRE